MRLNKGIFFSVSYRKLSSLALIFVLAFTTIHAVEEKKKKSLKLGEVTLAKGEVMARSKGKWLKVKKTPFPIYSADKIVTRKGRAVLKFNEKSSIKIDVDSNLSFNQKTEKKGILFFKKEVSVTQTNILVGDIWFDVKTEKNKQYYKFKSPTMTAAIRGTSGPIKQGLSGDTEIAIIGDGDVSGSFKKVENPQPKTVAQMQNQAVPASNPKIANSPIQKAATKAVTAQETAFKAAAKANTATKASTTTATTPAAGAAAANSAVKAVETAGLQVQSKAETAKALLDNTSEVLLEAQLLGDTEKVAEIKKDIETQQAVIEKVETFAKQIQESTTKISNSPAASNDALAAIVATAEVAANASATQVANAEAHTVRAIAQSSGNPAAIAAAVKAVETTKAVAAKVEKLVEKVSAITNNTGVGGQPNKAATLAAQVIVNAAKTNAALAAATTSVAVNNVAGDTAAAATAQASAQKAAQLTSTADIAANNAQKAAQSGDLDALIQTQKASAEVAKAAKQVERKVILTGTVNLPPELANAIITPPEAETPAETPNETPAEAAPPETAPEDTAPPIDANRDIPSESQ